MLDQLLAWKAVVIGAWLVAFLLLERIFPASPWKRDNPQQGFSQIRHLLQNASLWGINLLVSPLLVIVFTAVAVDYAPPWRAQWLAGAPRWFTLVVDLLILDLWIYGWHRLNHRFPFFWRFHQIHHYDQQLDASTAMRFHFGEVALSAMVRMPVIFVFAIPLTSVVLFEILVALTTIFHHANIRLPAPLERRLSRLIITPSIHWVHHHAVRRDTDSNYGTILSCWDRLFRSLSDTERTPDMALGIEGRIENRLSRLFLLPFRKPGDGGR